MKFVTLMELAAARFAAAIAPPAAPVVAPDEQAEAHEEVHRVPFPSLHLGATLGSGATGDVFAGTLGGAPVAVKRLKLTAVPDARAELARRFRAEMDVLSRYAHPRLARLLGWAEEEDPRAPHPFAIVLELLEEGSLGDWLRGPAGEPPQRAGPGGAPLSPLERVDVALGAAAGLAFLHGQTEAGEGGGIAGGGPVLHRDVKSSNIGLTRVGGGGAAAGALYAKLLDCGLAKAVKPGVTLADGVSFTQGLAGTPGYTAPEVATRGRYTAQSEVYSLGVVLLELLLGQRAGLNTAADTVEAAIDAAAGGAQPGTALAAAAEGVWPADAARALAELALHCMQPRESARPVGVGAVVARLRALRPLAAAAALPPLVDCFCGDAVAEAAGIHCGSGARHFACVGCFNQHVRSFLEPGLLAGGGGRVPCVKGANCAHQWDLDSAEPGVDKATLKLWAKALQAMAIDAPREKAEREAALAAAEAAALRERAAEARARALRVVIVDRDLKMCCPRCALVFGEYSGCNALTCPKCAAGFCAVCLKDCGADAHPHIKASAACGPEYFNRPLFDREKRKRFLARVVASVAGLAGEGAALQRAVVAELGKADLRDLGITEAEVLAGARVAELQAGGGGGGGDPKGVFHAAEASYDDGAFVRPSRFFTHINAPAPLTPNLPFCSFKS